MHYPRTRFHNLGAIAVSVLGGLVAASVLLRGALDDDDGTFGRDEFVRPGIHGRLS
jgi:hypothetical protein